MEQLKIHYDLIEKAINKNWTKGVIVLCLIAIVIMANLVSLKYSFVSIFVFGFIDNDRWRNYYILNKIKCPNCRMNYFNPFFANRENIKSLLKSNPKCKSCNYEAEIISEYKTMY